MRKRVVLLLAGGTVLVLALAQVFLPRIAASEIAARVGRYGTVQSVTVAAWPAVELLWGSAESVTVRAAALHLSAPQAARLLWEARDLTTISLAAASVEIGRVRLEQARLRKRGSALSAEGRISAADLRAALTPGVDLQLLASGGGELRLKAGGGLFGLGAPVLAVALASEGRLIAHPLGSPLQGLRLTLFSDRHVYVEGIAASALARPRGSYSVSLSARLR